MRKGSRITNKKVSIPEEDEEEKIKKVESKKAMIRAEFEKHKKELKVNVADASKVNEIRLKNQLEELLAGNATKRQNLQRIMNSYDNLEHQNLEATHFNETMTKFNITRDSDACLSVGFHPNRTTSMLLGLTKNNEAEVLSDKNAQLKETLSNIQLVMEQEDEANKVAFERYSELKKNQVLLQKKVNELTKMNDHAGKRFTDLQRVEFLARTKQAAAQSNLKELKDDLRELKGQESSYKKQKEDDKKKETEYLNAQQAEMSNVLIELDKKRAEYQQKLEEAKKLDLQYEEMRNKRKNTRIVTKYIETLNALEDQKNNNLVAAHQALKEMSEKLDNSREESPYKIPQSQQNKRESVYTFNEEMPQSASSPGEEDQEKKSGLLNRNYYIEKIRQFYEQHPEGPAKYADNLIEQYLIECYQEESLKTNYEELQNQKKKYEAELQDLEKQLEYLKGKNEYIVLGRSGSKILESNEQDAIDAGIFVMDSHQTTLNQAKFQFEDKKESDNQADLFANTEAFTLRCYLDSLEMITRLEKVVYAIYNQSGGLISDQLRDASRNIHIQLILLKRGKKSESSGSQTFSDMQADPYKTLGDNSSTSEKEREQEPVLVLDVQEVYKVFLSIFEGETQKASEFIDHIRKDVMISSFISIEEIKAYLRNCQSNAFMESQINKALNHTEDLRKLATENMLLRFETLYRLYTDLMAAVQESIQEACIYLDERGVKAEVGDIIKRMAEPSNFLNKALEKKWQTLMEKYDYDPTRDYRKEVFDTETTERNVEAANKQHTDETEVSDKELWDTDDLKAKLNEIVGSGLKKQKGDVFKGKNEEEQKRLQAKKEREKQKLAIENMSDDDFMDWQRKQIKKDVKEDFVSEETEFQIFKKAQADLTKRLSQGVPIEELKRMIENSKVLSKIQILEKQKFENDGKRNLKYNPLPSHIPQEPKRVPKSFSYTPHPEYKIASVIFLQDSNTPTNKATGGRFPQLSSERTDGDFEGGNAKSPSYRNNFMTRTSKFKPPGLHTEFNSLPTFENEKPLSHKSQRLFTLQTLKQMPNENGEDKESPKNIPSLTAPKSQSQREPKKFRKRKGLGSTLPKKPQPNIEYYLGRSKSGGGIDLPVLEKVNKKPTQKSKKHNNSERLINEHQNLNMLLNLQTDPSLNMVYSPTFFATSFPSSALTDDINYKFDSFKFKVPGLLISEKI